MKDVRGAEAYTGLMRAPDFSSVNVSHSLKDAGIPGIKYLDQGSRSAGEGSRNYVVFNDQLIDILRKYGLAGMAGGTAAMGQNMDSQ